LNRQDAKDAKKISVSLYCLGVLGDVRFIFPMHLRVLKHDVRNRIATIAAAVDGSFQQVVQVADHHGLQWLELAAIRLA
jgi:hypothetical protein